ncbi:MAG: helix-turn-helix domain-containing protein [Anaerolineae bacterium]
MDKAPVKPRTAEVLERWRKCAGLSKQRLADLADVSATYVRTIAAGIDDLGRLVVPSAGVIRKLARGIGQTGANDLQRAEIERQVYSELMAAAGYLEAAAREEPADALRGKTGGEPAAGDLCAAPPHKTVNVALRDSRLLAALCPLLQDWELLGDADQALFLGIIEYINARRQGVIVSK